MPANEEHPTRDAVAAVVRTVLARGRAAAGTGADGFGKGVDDAVRALVGQRVRRAIDDPSRATTAVDVVLALSHDGPSSVAGRLGSTGTWLAGRGRAARAIGGRTPVGLALRFGPGLYEAITSSLGGLDAAAGHLVARVRERGHEPDPERTRRVLVQALTGQPVDPDRDADHAAMLRVWLADAARRMAPFGLRRISGFTRGRTPEAVVAALGAVDVDRLRA